MSAKIAAFVKAFPQLHKNAAGIPVAEMLSGKYGSKWENIPNPR